MKSKIINTLNEMCLTQSQIAVKFGVSRQYVGQIALLAGIKPFRKQKKPAYVRKTKEFDPLKSQRQKYKAHKSGAAKRGIEFLLTFDEWWGLWEPHYAKMGRKKGCMCMCRTLDRGAYVIGNVRIDHVESNGHEKKTSRLYKKGTKWMRQPTSVKGSGCGLPNFLMCQQKDSNDVEEEDYM